MQHKFCPIVHCSTSLRQTITQQKLKHQLQRCIKICFFFCAGWKIRKAKKNRRRRGKQGHRHDSAGGLVAAQHQHQHPSLSCCKIHRTNCWFCGTIKIPWKKEREKKTRRTEATQHWDGSVSERVLEPGVVGGWQRAPRWVAASQQQDVALGLRLNLASRTLVQERQDKNANAIMLCSSPHCTPSLSLGLSPGSGSLAPTTHTRHALSARM